MTCVQFVALAIFLTTAVSEGDLRAADSGEALADGCTSCHGIQGKSRGEIPSLDGLSRADFRQAMIDFRAQRRTATIMNRIARVYSDEDIALLADYFSSVEK